MIESTMSVIRVTGSMARYGLGAMLLVTALSVWADEPQLIPAAPDIAATSYILIDADTNQVLVRQNEDQRLPPASLTKMMTSYIAERELMSERLNLQDTARISVKAWKMGGSKMFVQEGKEVSIEDLLRGIIVQSGNDASVAMAEHIAGSEDSFVDLMNQTAQQIGLTNTQFRNATGWPDSGHYSSAEDLALLARRIIQDSPEFYSIYAEKSFTYNGITQSNRNSLLWRNPEVDGLKTGHTEEAGYCLVASARRDGMRLISVVMGAKSSEARAQETQKLLTYGFRYYQTLQLYAVGDTVHSARVWAGLTDDVALGSSVPVKLTLPRGAQDQIEAQLLINPVIKAPVQQGDPLGVLRIHYQDEVLWEQPLVALAAVKQAGFFARIWDHISLTVYQWMQ